MTLVEVERACFENCSLHNLMLRTYTNITVSFDLEQPTMHTRANKRMRWQQEPKCAAKSEEAGRTVQPEESFSGGDQARAALVTPS